MKKKIAVLVDNKGHTASLYEAGSIVIYEKLSGQWQEKARSDFVLEKVTGMKELRWQMQQIIRFLDDCQLFVAQSIAGVPYFELEKADIRVWEVTGPAEDFLENVWQGEQEKQVLSEPQTETAAPQLLETFPGCFRISLLDIQRNHALLTSKQVLQPILREGNFYTLEVICNHVPPWLELELAMGNYQSHIERSHGESKILIEAKVCANEI